MIQQSTFKAISSERNYIRKIDQIGLFSLSNHRKPLSKSAFKRQIRPCSGAESRQKMSPKREQERVHCGDSSCWYSVTN